jgi:Uma2 family endonuclease
MAMTQRPPALNPSLDEVIRDYDRMGPIPVSEAVYLHIAMDDPNATWELHDGLLVEKPGMCYRHGDVSLELGFHLAQQLDWTRFRVRVNSGRLHLPDGTCLVPAVIVIPTAILGPEIYRPDALEVYDRPLPFVGDIWSPTITGYDSDAKLPEYRMRGDLEIWCVQPFERTVTTWRRRPDGGYDELTFTGGTVRLHALPEVVIDLDALFA